MSEEQISLAGKDVVIIENGPAVPISAANLTWMDMVNRAMAANNMEMCEKFMGLHERFEKKEAIKAFNRALSRAFAEMPTIIKNRVASFQTKTGTTRYQYEDLAQVERTVKPTLARHGINYRWKTNAPINEPVSVTCMVWHDDSHYEENTLSCGRDDTGSKNSIQALKSAITYLQRITLMSLLGIASAQDDDDGHAADASNGNGDDCISSEEIIKLQALVTKTNADVDALLKHVNAPTIYEIKRTSFPRLQQVFNIKASNLGLTFKPEEKLI